MKWEPKISLTNFPCMDPTRVIPLFQYLYDTNDIDYVKEILTHPLKVEKHNQFIFLILSSIEYNIGPFELFLLPKNGVFLYLSFPPIQKPQFTVENIKNSVAPQFIEIG